MGLESYFIHILPDGVVWLGYQVTDASSFEGHSPLRASSIVDSIKSAFAGRLVSEESAVHSRKLVVEEAIEVWIDDEKGYFQKATLVGCFAWYGEGLHICYRIACLLSQYGEVRLFFQPLGFMPLRDEQSFIATIQRIYDDQYRAFRRTFGDIRAKTLPHKDFYNYYKSLGNPLKLLLWNLKRIWRGRQHRRT